MAAQGNMAQLITEKRKEKGLTQSQLAEILGVTDKAVSKWERDQGYPDIMLVTKLAAALSLTATELLNGCADDTEHDEGAIIEATIQYAGKAVKSKKKDYLSTFFWITTFSLIVSALTCIIVDISVSGGLGWSVIVIGSVVFTWLVIYPVFCFNKHKLTWSVVSLSVFVYPLLYLIDVQVSTWTGTTWFVPVALQIAAVSTVYLWIVYSLFAFTKINRWICASFAFFLSPILNYVAQRVTETDMDITNLKINIASQLIVAILLLAFGLYRRSKQIEESVNE